MTAVDETEQTELRGGTPRPGDARSPAVSGGAADAPDGAAATAVGEESVEAGGPWWLRHRLAVFGALLVALLVAGAVAVHQYQDQQDRLAAVEGGLSQTEARIQATDIELDATIGERVDAEVTLAEALAELAEIEAQLVTTGGELGAAVTERDEIIAAVESITGELGTTLDGVAENTSRVELQGDQVVGLSVCFDGVSLAMNRQAVGNRIGAAAALSDVADTCDLTILSIALSLEDVA